MRYDKVLKWLQQATSKDESRPTLMRPAYVEKADVTIATDGFRVHIAAGKYAPPPEEGGSAFRSALSIVRDLWPTHATAEGVWYTNGEGIAIAVAALKFAARAVSETDKRISVIMEPPKLTITPDLESEPSFSIDLPGRVEGDVRGAIEVNAAYLADALNGLAESKREVVALKLRMPPTDTPTLSAGLQIRREDVGLEAYICPIRSRAYAEREASRKKEAVAG